MNKVKCCKVPGYVRSRQMSLLSPSSLLLIQRNAPAKQEEMPSVVHHGVGVESELGSGAQTKLQMREIGSASVSRKLNEPKSTEK